MYVLNSTALQSAAILLLVTPVPLHHVVTSLTYRSVHSQAIHYTDVMFKLGKTLSHKEQCRAHSYAVGLCRTGSERIYGAFIPGFKTPVKYPISGHFYWCKWLLSTTPYTYFAEKLSELLKIQENAPGFHSAPSYVSVTAQFGPKINKDNVSFQMMKSYFIFLT